MCLVYAYFFDKTESGYAYKRYAYKKKHVWQWIMQKHKLLFTLSINSLTYVKTDLRLS